MIRFGLTFVFMVWTLLTVSLADSKEKQPMLVAVYSASWCAPCHSLKARLLKSGAKLKGVTVKEYPRSVRGLPTCIYKDLNDCTLQDNGERVRQGEYVLPLNGVVEVREVAE